MGIDRAGADSGAEKVEENKPVDRRPAPPPDRPGQEPEGVPSRLEVRRATAAANERAAEVPAATTDKNISKPTSEQGPVVTEKNRGSSAALQSAETSETTGQDRSSSGTYDGGHDQPGPSSEALAGECETDAQRGTEKRPQSRDGQAAVQELEESAASGQWDAGSSVEERSNASEDVPRSTKFVSSAPETPSKPTDGLRDNPVDSVADETGEGDSRTASTPDAAAERQPPERADKPYEVKPPQIVCDYYTNIPPTAQDRYLVRDQSNPVPVFDGSPTRDQVAQGRVGDCGIVATLGSVAEHRPGAIENAIRQVGNGKYEITLHEITEATRTDPVARPTGDVKTYRVNDELPVATDDPARPPAGIKAGSCGWPTLMEKVIAAEDQTWDTTKKAGWDREWTTWHKSIVDQDRASAGLGASPKDAPMGYNRLDIGSTAYQQAGLLAKLTGEDAEVRRIPGERQGDRPLLDGFGGQLSTGKPVLVGTRGLRVTNERLPDGIYAGHAYEVTKIEDDKIHLRNPWGYDHPDPMEAQTFREYFRWYNQDGTRDGHYTTLK